MKQRTMISNLIEINNNIFQDGGQDGGKLAAKMAAKNLNQFCFRYKDKWSVYSYETKNLKFKYLEIIIIKLGFF